MANFELFLMIYVLVFYYEIRRMPGEAGYCFYGLVTAGMLGVAAVLGAHLHGMLPWELNLTQEQAEYDLILNLARVLGYVKEKKILSKKEGGLWGVENLPEQFHPLIRSALDEYESGLNVQYDPEPAREYASWMLRQITSGQQH